MPRFVQIAGEGVRVNLDEDEASLLREMCAEMKLLLEADIPRTDAVMQRLFPDAYEDPEDADSYRDLVGDDLHVHKLNALRAVSDRLGRSGPLESSIPDEEVDQWLSFLTDIRLAIGARLDVTEEMMSAELDPEDPNAPALSALHWLGWIQGTLLQALMPTHQDPNLS